LAACRNDVKWVPCSARFALLGCHARGTGALQVYALNHGKLEIMCETEKQQGFKCGTFGASSLEERHFATGDYEGRLAVPRRTDLCVGLHTNAQPERNSVSCFDLPATLPQ